LSDTQILGFEVSRGKVLPEWLNLHVDLCVRKVSPWPDYIRDQIAILAEEQGELGWPAEAGNQMKIQQAIYSSAAAD